MGAILPIIRKIESPLAVIFILPQTCLKIPFPVVFNVYFLRILPNSLSGSMLLPSNTKHSSIYKWYRKTCGHRCRYIFIGPLALHSGTLMPAFFMFDALTIGSENFDSSFVALKMFGSSKGIGWTTNQIPNLKGQSTMFYWIVLICSYVIF
jgi:hypothetical protein